MREPMVRYTELHADEMTPKQRRVYETIKTGPRGNVFIPHLLLLRNPELADRAQRMGVLLRYETSLPPLVSECVILVVAHHWKNGYEWSHHLPLARKAGLEKADEDAIMNGMTRPADTKVALVVEFCRELLSTGTIADAGFLEARETFGEAGVVELISLIGYYSMLAMLMNSFQVPGNKLPPQ